MGVCQGSSSRSMKAKTSKLPFSSEGLTAPCGSMSSSLAMGLTSLAGRLEGLRLEWKRDRGVAWVSELLLDVEDRAESESAGGGSLFFDDEVCFV